MFEMRPDGNPAYTDAFLDCTCLAAAADLLADKCYLHRCLEHTKKNVRGAGIKMIRELGHSRLRNKQLSEPLLQWLEFSAEWCASAEEFHAFWSSILDRMENNRCKIHTSA